MKSGYGVITSADQTATVTNAGSDTLDFDFPTREGISGTNPEIVGNIAVNFICTDTSGASDNLAITVTPILADPDDGSDIVVDNNVITLVSGLDWTDAETYHYPIADPIGPCKGLRVTFDQTGMAAGVNSFKTWLTVQ